MYYFSKTSKSRLITCHPDLQKLFNEVIKYRDCSIICGYRNMFDQNQAYELGYSNAEFPDSFHNSHPSNAVDVMPYPIIWNDTDGVIEFAGFVMGVAAVMGIQIKWGGHFVEDFDGSHYELAR